MTEWLNWTEPSLIILVRSSLKFAAVSASILAVLPYILLGYGDAIFLSTLWTNLCYLKHFSCNFLTSLRPQNWRELGPSLYWILIYRNVVPGLIFFLDQWNFSISAIRLFHLLIIHVFTFILFKTISFALTSWLFSTRNLNFGLFRLLTCLLH